MAILQDPDGVKQQLEVTQGDSKTNLMLIVNNTLNLIVLHQIQFVDANRIVHLHQTTSLLFASSYIRSKQRTSSINQMNKPRWSTIMRFFL